MRQLAGVKEFRFEDPQTLALKGFVEPVRVYPVAWDERLSSPDD